MKNLKILYICLFSLTLSSCAYYEKVFKKESTEFEPKPEVSTNYIIEELWSIDAGGGRSPKSTVLQPSFDSKNNIYTNFVMPYMATRATFKSSTILRY